MRKRFLWALTGAVALAVSALSPVAAAPPGGTPPAGWEDAALNGEDPPGKTTVEGSGAEAKWTITGGGTDIQSEDFHFAYTTLPANGGITARILSHTGGHSDGWAKTGVMLRKTTDAGSGMMTLSYTRGFRLEGLYRVEQDEATEYPAAASNVGRSLDGGPIWMRVQRQGTTYEMFWSDDGQNWNRLVKAEMQIPANQPVLAGITACMHGGEDGPVTAVFDNVSVSADIVVPAPAGPARLQAFPGSGASLLTFGTVPNAAGYNIYRREAGQPATAAVKVNAQPTANAWFIDTGLANGKPLIYTVKAVFKNATGDLTEGTASSAVVVTPQEPLFGGFFRHDIGTTNPGSATIEGTTLTIKAAGGDIWDAADGGTYLMAAVAGDYTVSAKLLELPKEEPATDGFAKVGVMIRSGLGLGDPYAYIFSSATRDPNMMYEVRRLQSGGNVGDATSNLGANPGINTADMKFPLWLKLTKAGGIITGSYSHDGTAYEQIGDPIDFGRMPAVTYAGVAATAHNDAGSVTGKLDAAYGIQIQ